MTEQHLSPTSPETIAALRAALDGPWAVARDRMREIIADPALRDGPDLDIPRARERVLEQMRAIAATGWPTAVLGVDGDPGGAVIGIESLALASVSLMVKSGVQWGLFGGAVENLGTERHHDRYLTPLIDLDLLGCFAMTEIGHGSDVQQLETTAEYDPATDEIVVHSPTPSATKDYIGGAAEHARMAAVFARLIVADEDHGVHCVLVPIRGEDGADLPGVTTTDDGRKGGLAGVDNGRISFDSVRVPRENLLNRWGDIDEAGVYSSPIEHRGKRFFTMLGTLVRGRISVGGAAGAATRLALLIAVRYAEQRRQFGSPVGTAPDGGGPGETDEVLLLDYRAHRLRLLPRLARSYALAFAQNELVATMDEIQRDPDPDPVARRELEAQAAGLKAANTWHANDAIQTAREACGGAGYMAENRLTDLRADIDVFATFEGDNTVLTQLVAKELLTAYSDEVSDYGAVGWLRFVAETVVSTVRERAATRTVLQTILDRSDETLEEGDLSDPAVQLRMFEDRAQHVLETAARRLRGADSVEGNDLDGDGEVDDFERFDAVQDHILMAGRVHIEQLVLEAFSAAVEQTEDEAAREILDLMRTLFALDSIDRDKAWFLEHRRLSVERSKAVTRHIGELVDRLRPHAAALVDAFGIPEELIDSAMLDGPGTDPVRNP